MTHTISLSCGAAQQLPHMWRIRLTAPEPHLPGLLPRLLPHSHKRAAASVVYALDPGDEEAAAADAMNGVLMFADPRIEACCQHKPHYVSTPAVPPMGPGSMIIFPAHFTHLVTPYWGRRPRISIAWNINSDSVEGDLRHDGVLS